MRSAADNTAAWTDVNIFKACVWLQLFPSGIPQGLSELLDFNVGFNFKLSTCPSFYPSASHDLLNPQLILCVPWLEWRLPAPQPARWDCNIHPASGCSTSICFLWGSPSCKIWEKYPNLEIKALPSLASFSLPFGCRSYALHFAWTHSLMLGQIPSGSRFSSPLRSATHPSIADTSFLITSLLLSHHLYLQVSEEPVSFKIHFSLQALDVTVFGVFVSFLYFLLAHRNVNRIHMSMRSRNSKFTPLFFYLFLLSIIQAMLLEAQEGWGGGGFEQKVRPPQGLWGDIN